MSNRMRRRPGLVPNLRRTAFIVIFALIAPLYIFGADALAQSVRQLKPTGLTGTVVTAGVQLDWNAPQANADEVTGYKIERRRPAHGETTLGDLVEDTGSTDTTYVDTTATEEGTEYIYRVVARRGNTLSARSNKLVTTWQASEDDETTNRNSFEFVSDTDEELETSAQEAGSVCDSNPDACLPWVKYSERSVPDSSSWFGTRGAWELRLRRPTFVSGPPAIASAVEPTDLSVTSTASGPAGPGATVVTAGRQMLSSTEPATGSVSIWITRPTRANTHSTEFASTGKAAATTATSTT